MCKRINSKVEFEKEKLPGSHLGCALAAFDPGAGPLMMLEGIQLGSKRSSGSCE